MPTTREAVFHYEVLNSGDEDTGAVTTITCHGRLGSETSGQIKQRVKPLIPMGRRIVLDLTDVSVLDNAKPGTLVGLKVSAVREGFCRLEFFSPSPRQKKPGRLSSLTQLFSS